MTDPGTLRERRKAVKRIPHDQICKELFAAFLRELVQLCCPDIPPQLLLGEPIFLTQESYTRSPRGSPRYSDVAVKLPALIIHIETQEEDRKDDPSDLKMLHHGTALMIRHPEPVLPIGVWFVRGKGGLGKQRYRRRVGPTQVLSFTYYRLGVCDLKAEDYLAGDNPLGYALAARMLPGGLSRAKLLAECYRKIAQAQVSDEKRFLLIHFVATYLKLNPDEDREFRQMMEQPEYAEAKQTQRSWSEELMDEGEKVGMARSILAFLQARGIPVSNEIRDHIMACTDDERLNRWITRAVTASSAAEVVADS